MKHRFLYIMALLLTVAAGARAQSTDPDPIDLTYDATTGVWTYEQPAYDTELEVTYYTDEEVAEMEEAAFTEGVDLTYDEASDAWTLAETPGFDIELEVTYYEEVNVTANQGETGEYWATFYNNTSNYEASAGTQVFKVNLSGTTITMTEITDGIVKSGQGVVLKNTSGSSITMTETESASNGDWTGNSLQGTMTSITNPNPGHIFVLSKKDGTGVGFYKLTDTGTIGANKAYLYYSGTLAREFFSFDEATSINEELRMKNEEGIARRSQFATAPVYDLQGRRVIQPTKGLYIVNGKKVVIK